MPRIYVIENHFVRTVATEEMVVDTCEHCGCGFAEVVVQPDKLRRIHSFTIRDEDQATVVRTDTRLCHGHFIHWLQIN